MKIRSLLVPQSSLSYEWPSCTIDSGVAVTAFFRPEPADGHIKPCTLLIGRFSGYPRIFYDQAFNESEALSEFGLIIMIV